MNLLQERDIHIYPIHEALEIKRRRYQTRSLCGGGKSGRGGQWAWKYFDVTRVGRAADDITVQCPWLALVNMACAEYLINFHRDKINVPAAHLNRRILSNEYYNYVKLLQPIGPPTLGGHYAVWGTLRIGNEKLRGIQKVRCYSLREGPQGGPGDWRFMGNKIQDTVFAVPAMHADNLEAFDLEEYPDLADDLVRGRVYLICEMQFVWESVGDDGDPIQNKHDCACVLIKEFDTVRYDYKLAPRPDNGLTRESAAALHAAGCRKLLEHGNMSQSKWHMLPVEHVLGRLCLAPVTHQPSLRDRLARRQAAAASAAATARDESHPQARAGSESGGSEDGGAADSDSNEDAPAARGRPGRRRRGAGGASGASASRPGTAAAQASASAAPPAGAGAAPRRTAGDGWSGRRWEFGTEHDCDRLWWTIPWVEKWGRDLTYRD